MTTLEERRHQADMAMVYKVLTGKDQVDPAEWFTMAGEAVRATRTTTDPLTVASDVADWTSGASFSQSE